MRELYPGVFLAGVFLLGQPAVAATLTVTSLADNGANTLRAAILAASQNPLTPDTIVFDPGLAGGTITLAQSSI